MNTQSIKVVAFRGCRAKVYRSVNEASEGEGTNRTTIMNRINDGNRLRNGAFVDIAIDGINYEEVE